MIKINVVAYTDSGMQKTRVGQKTYEASAVPTKGDEVILGDAESRTDGPFATVYKVQHWLGIDSIDVHVTLNKEEDSSFLTEDYGWGE